MHEFFQKAVDAKRNQVALRVERLDDNGKPDRYGSAPALVNKKAPPALPADLPPLALFRSMVECAAYAGVLSLGAARATYPASPATTAAAAGQSVPPAAPPRPTRDARARRGDRTDWSYIALAAARAAS